MKRLAIFTDGVYPYSYIDHTRTVARAILLNEKNEILLETIERDDIFGKARYLETPGGGVNAGESLRDGLKRELLEECGLIVEIIDEIGLVEDDYNLIHRHNLSHYFLCRAIGAGEMCREAYETLWIRDVSFLPLDAILEEVSHPQSDIARIVYRREKVIFEAVKERMKAV